MKRFLSLLGAIALMVGLLAALPSAASAVENNQAASQNSGDEPASCEGADVENGTGNCADVVKAESHSKSSAASRVVDVNGIKLHSEVTVLANIKANGTPQSQQTDCYRIPRAMSLWTSYNAEGTTGWHWKSYPKGYRFCRINGVVRDPICHNQVKIGVPRSHPPKNAITGKVKFVQKLKWHVKAVAKADVKVTSIAKAWCNTNAAYAYGEGKGSAFAMATGRASLRGSVLSKLTARVEAMAAGDLEANLGGMSVIDVQAQVRASAFVKATSDAKAKAVCSDTPPEDTPPGFTEVEQPNDVLVNNSRTIRVRGVVPAGQTATLSASAQYGTITSGSSQTVTGQFDVTVTYMAPSEVPAGGNDTTSFRVFNANNQGESRSVTFQIRPAPVDPL